jgi:putative thiamine transport system ATP-binding protein
MTDPLHLEAVRIALPTRTLIPALDVTVAPGECVTLMGRSGSGKSTLLAFIAGTFDPAFVVSGRVSIGDIDITRLAPERRRVGILFQDDLLFPHLSVGGNLGFALEARVRDRGERRARIEQALEESELQGFADRDPATLSGGQRCCARCCPGRRCCSWTSRSTSSTRNCAAAFASSCSSTPRNAGCPCCW